MLSAVLMPWAPLMHELLCSGVMRGCRRENLINADLGLANDVDRAFWIS